VEFPESNVKQAALIPSASAILNPRGTAPGWWVEKNRAEGDKYIIAMPGVPAEMYRMWEHEVAPRLREMTGEVLITRILKTAAVSEARIDEMLSPLLKSTNPSVGIYAKIDGVHARIAAKAPTEDEARALIAPVEEEARRILGNAIWGADEDTLESAVGAMLRERGLTVATMESCTGGLLASTITDVDGASDYFKGGYVAYTAELKVTLGVDPGIIEAHGVISSETAADMARAARAALSADYGVGVTGIAGPDPVEGKPPGTIHLAVHDGTAPETISFTYNQGRIANKRRATNTAIFLLRRTLLAREA
jgi:nicotinamide-nucleotide amidase